MRYKIQMIPLTKLRKINKNESDFFRIVILNNFVEEENNTILPH